MKNRKGFIGPLGDDIPSIFPIVFAVILFTGTVLYANQLIAQKAKMLEIREGALALSYLVTEKGFVETLPSPFKTSLGLTCEEKVKTLAGSKGVTFLITLKRFCNGIPADFASTNPVLNPYSSTEEPSPFYVAKSSDAGSTWDYCTNLPTPPLIDELFPQPPNSVVLSYPVAVPCPDEDSFTNGVGVINVIAWK